MHNLDGLGYREATVIVTGAFSGMGEATARILGELGARVHVVDIKQPGIPHERFFQTDLSQPDQVRATAAALREIGPVHYYFSCAGVPPVLGALRCMLINYVGARQLIEEVLPNIVDGAGIGIISSDAALGWQRNMQLNLEFLKIDDPVEAKAFCEKRADVLRDGYTSSKEMLLVWAQHRSVSLGRTRGIRINCIAPGPTRTPFMTEMSQRLSADFFDKFPYPLLGRPTTPEEQAWPLILLTSKLNHAVTGGVLYTDQGFAAGMYTGAIDSSVLTPGLKGN
jgi:NAD(P)-dependent dehydrogenase (short-subunit alcohol dehydrogenase family)